jgi:superfamily II DNA helicase RecQ
MILIFNLQDSRFVFHLTMPSSISAYYKECSRGGRDGAVASCVLFYQFANHLYLQRLIEGFMKLLWLIFPINRSNGYLFLGQKRQESRGVESKTLMEMLSFCEIFFVCPNALIANHLGEQPIICDKDGLILCENCTAEV